MHQYFVSVVPGHQFLHLSCIKDCRIIVQYALTRVKLAFPDARITIKLTSIQTQGIYPLAMQASTCIYLYYHATGFDTLRALCLILSKITVSYFTVYSLQTACELHFNCPQG